MHFLLGNGTTGFSAERLQVAGRWVKSCFCTCPISSTSLTSNALTWEYMSQINFPLPWSCKLRLFKISITSVRKARSHFHSVSISSGTVFPLSGERHWFWGAAQKSASKLCPGRTIWLQCGKARLHWQTPAWIEKLGTACVLVCLLWWGFCKTQPPSWQIPTIFQHSACWWVRQDLYL